jgi:hypothetical protein
VYSGLSASPAAPDADRTLGRPNPAGEVEEAEAGAAPSRAAAAAPAARTAPAGTPPASTTPMTTTSRTSSARSTGDQVPVPEAVANRGAGWEPAIVVAYPVEPQASEEGEPLELEVPEGSDDPRRPEPPVAIEDRYVEVEALEDEHDHQGQPVAETPVKPEPATPTPPAEQAPEAGDALLEAPPSAGTAKPASRRRRASVPSWDEIMFGGPPRKPT